MPGSSFLSSMSFDAEEAAVGSPPSASASARDKPRSSSASEPRLFRFGIQLARADSAREWREAAVRAEAYGYDVLLVPDHFGSQWAPLVALTVAADATPNLRIGTRRALRLAAQADRCGRRARRPAA